MSSHSRIQYEHPSFSSSLSSCTDWCDVGPKQSYVATAKLTFRTPMGRKHCAALANPDVSRRLSVWAVLISTATISCLCVLLFLPDTLKFGVYTLRSTSA